MRKLCVLAVFSVLVSLGALQAQDAVKNADGLRATDSYTLVGDKNFVTDFAA